MLDQLERAGEFHADGRRVPKAVRPVFGWMRRQMAERVEHASGRPLIWLIASADLGRRGVCDWRCARRGGVLCAKTHISPGKVWVRVSIPSGRLLLSDFAWWADRVLSYGYVPLDEADDARWERRVRRELGLRSGAPIPWGLGGVSDETRLAAIASWTRIFDVDPTGGRTVQATVEQLFVDDVVDTLAGPAIDDVPAAYRHLWSTYVQADR